MTEAPKTKLLLAKFDQEATVIDATRKIRESGIVIVDVYTPYPVHGLEDAMGLPESKLGRYTFLFGAIGLVVAILLQLYVNLYDWPMNIGGKPNNAWPAFIPISFELTILFAGVLSVVGFLVKSGLGPGQAVKIKDPQITDDAFVVAIKMDDDGFDMEKTVDLLKSNSAVEIKETLVVL